MIGELKGGAGETGMLIRKLVTAAEGERVASPTPFGSKPLLVLLQVILWVTERWTNLVTYEL